jgi:hypothetical protein
MALHNELMLRFPGESPILFIRIDELSSAYRYWRVVN